MQEDFLSLFQTQLLRDKLAEQWKLEDEKLLPVLMDYAQARPEQKKIVKAFMISWKHNHPNGHVHTIKKARKAEDEPETFEERLSAEVKPARQVTVRQPGAGSIIDQILTLYKAGKTRAEIVAAGFNKSTVARQCGEYEKSKNK